MIPVGDAAAVLYEDMSMNSSNGPPSPIVVEPGDREVSDGGGCRSVHFTCTLPNFIGRWWEGRTSQLVLQWKV